MFEKETLRLSTIRLEEPPWACGLYEHPRGSLLLFFIQHPYPGVAQRCRDFSYVLFCVSAFSKPKAKKAMVTVALLFSNCTTASSIAPKAYPVTHDVFVVSSLPQKSRDDLDMLSSGRLALSNRDEDEPWLLEKRTCGIAMAAPSFFAKGLKIR